MNQPAPPILPNLQDILDMPAAKLRAHQRGVSILNMLQDELTKIKAPWYSERWAESVFQRAFHEFDHALDRWRELFRANTRQMDINQKVMNTPAASERERRDAKQRHDEAFRQREILLQQGSTLNSDFYTYRYLASKGFLPGYNFPRLPPWHTFSRAGQNRQGKFLESSKILGVI